MLGKVLDFKIKDFDIKGAGVSQLKNRKVFVWGSLPEEEVSAEIVKRKKRYFEAVVLEVKKSNPNRIEPKEEHFLSCSPYQVLNEEVENDFKLELARRFFERSLGLELSEADIYSDKKFWGYRRKVEYSFADSSQGLSLAYHKRGKKEKMPIESCLLVDPRLNEKINQTVEFLREKGFSANMLKTIIGRIDESGKVLLGVYTYLNQENFKQEFPDFSENLDLAGFKIFYSSPLSPASVVSDTLYERGEDFLSEEFEGLRFKFGFFSFFQNNWNVFKQILIDIRQFVDKGDSVLDLYSGVGVLGLTIAERAKEVILVEIEREAVEFAKENIALNQIGNATVIESAAEKSLEFIEEDKVVILDPPRSGLHPKVVKTLARQRPKKIIYISCNISTLVRDLGLLLPHYKISFSRFYNMFPRTPHVETLVFLTRF